LTVDIACNWLETTATTAFVNWKSTVDKCVRCIHRNSTTCTTWWQAVKSVVQNQ